MRNSTPAASCAMTAQHFIAGRDVSHLGRRLRASRGAVVIAIRPAKKGQLIQIPARIWRGVINFERRGKKHLVQLV